jgi:hypothetical protein
MTLEGSTIAKHSYGFPKNLSIVWHVKKDVYTHTFWPHGDLPTLLSFLKKRSVLNTAAATPPCTVARAAAL